jgi:hypothetical protein
LEFKANNRKEWDLQAIKNCSNKAMKMNAKNWGTVKISDRTTFGTKHSMLRSNFIQQQKN